VPLGEARTDVHPVQGVAAETVDHDDRIAFAPEVDVVDRSAEVDELMPQCVRDYAERIPEHMRCSISATAAAERRPSWCKRSKAGNEVTIAMTSSASRREQPGRS